MTTGQKRIARRRASRERARITRERLAREIGVSAQTVYRWETGTRVPILALELAWDRALRKLIQKTF